MRLLPRLSALACVCLLIACSEDRPSSDADTRDASAADMGSADTAAGDTAAGDTAAGDTAAGDTAMMDSGSADVGMDTRVDTGDPGDPDDPANPGAFTLTTREATVSSSGRSTPVVAYIPDGEGVHPLVVFAPGFQVLSQYYAPLCERLASHGFVVVRADPPAGVPADHLAMRDDLAAVVDWALSADGAATRIDASQIGAFGHSLGGKLSTMLALSDSRVRALLGIDPVDGGGFGPSPSTPDIVPSESASLAIPVGYLGETTNGAGGFMPCAPTANNFQRFFEGSTAAPWAAEWDFEGADHMDFVHDAAGCGFFCEVCTPAGTADVPTVLASMSTLTVAFFRRHLTADAAMDGVLLTTPPAGTSVRSR